MDSCNDESLFFPSLSQFNLKRDFVKFSLSATPDRKTSDLLFKKKLEQKKLGKKSCPKAGSKTFWNEMDFKKKFYATPSSWNSHFLFNSFGLIFFTIFGLAWPFHMLFDRHVHVLSYSIKKKGSLKIEDEENRPNLGNKENLLSLKSKLVEGKKNKILKSQGTLRRNKVFEFLGF